MNKNKEDEDLLKNLCKTYNLSYKKVNLLLDVIKDYEMREKRMGIYDALKEIINTKYPLEKWS